jgi:ubiquitin C-terminal hydrolase
MSGLIGIHNMGLTCYANAVLQCLRSLPKISNLFVEGKYDTLFTATGKPKRRLQQDVTRSFADLIQKQNAGNRGMIRPGGFWEKMHPCIEDTVYEQMKIKTAHDSHEFLMFMLETLHESLSIPVEMQIMKSPPKTDIEKRVIESLEVWKKEFSKEYSPLVDMFFGLLHIKMSCSGCGATSHRWETFNTLKGAVPLHTAETEATPPSLISMLQNDMKEEEIEGYSCDACAPTRTLAKRTTSIWRLPQILVICLKRFTPDGRKITTPIQTSGFQPLTLEPLFSEESPERNGITEYTLRSVVDHHGGAGGGHYTGQVRSPVDDKWNIYDDQSVYSIANPVFGKSTYILFFEREMRKSRSS